MTWKIKPVRILTGAFETSLNAPGFSISLCNLSAASRELSIPVTELLDLLDAPTTAASWPNLTVSIVQNGTAQKPADDSISGVKSKRDVDLVGQSFQGPAVRLDMMLTL